MKSFIKKAKNISKKRAHFRKKRKTALRRNLMFF